MRWVGACGRGRDTPKMEKLETKLYRAFLSVERKKRGETEETEEKEKKRKKERK